MNLRGSKILCAVIPLLIGLLFGPPARGQSGCPLYWTEFTQLPERPAGRRNHAMVYDSARGRTVLFGGRDILAAYGTNQLYGGTWEFDGYSWQQRTGSELRPFRTIRQAVDALHCGTIRVQPGDYAESALTVNKLLTFQTLIGPVTIR